MINPKMTTHPGTATYMQSNKPYTKEPEVHSTYIIYQKDPWHAAKVEVNKYKGTARAPIAPISSTLEGKMIIIKTINGSTNSFKPLT